MKLIKIMRRWKMDSSSWIGYLYMVNGFYLNSVKTDVTRICKYFRNAGKVKVNETELTKWTYLWTKNSLTFSTFSTLIWFTKSSLVKCSYQQSFKSIRINESDPWLASMDAHMRCAWYGFIKSPEPKIQVRFYDPPSSVSPSVCL